MQDLSYLNRDLSKVVLLDTNPDHASLQPENAIIIPKWDGTPGDKGLVDMIPFLECESIALNVVSGRTVQLTLVPSAFDL